MKETTLTVNRKGGSYGFRRGNTFFTRDDVNYYDKIYAIRGKGVTEACEEKIRAKFDFVEIEFLDGQGRIQSNKTLCSQIPV